MRIAYWGDLTWALGRIGRAIQKYAGVPVDLYDWSRDTDTLFLERWREYDVIIVTTLFSGLDIPELNKKLLIISHFPVMDHPQFRETTCIHAGSRYGGVSIETCEEMERHGMKPAHWIPFGVDTDIFRVWHTVTGPIRRIGVIGNPNSWDGYTENKGLKDFAVLCDRLGAEPVYIFGREGDADLYNRIDLLVCTSRLEAGPLGIFEAAACGIPVLTRPVGNAQQIKGIETFDTVDEAVQKIQAWNKDRNTLREYTRRITEEVRTNWSMERLVKRMMKRITIPVVIICWNNYKYVQNTVRQLGKFTDNIIIMDNASTDPATRDYLASCGLDVRYNAKNKGPWVSLKCNKHIWDEMPDEFILTDPDLEFHENLPNDFIQRLSTISNRYCAHKTGFALRIDDFEDMYQYPYCGKRTIKEWESEFWTKRIDDDEYELYDANIDTTFVLVNKKYPDGKFIRVAGNFTARHIPWYVNNPFYTKEEIMSWGGQISSISICLRKFMS